MGSIINVLLLKKEAHLFDSKLFILKTFIAVIVAYLITLVFPLIQNDTISLLFGLVLTLEPVTITGIRSGLNQIYATFLGALLTAIIIILFGINVITIALSVSATLYLCLKIDFKTVSPVAIFTSIYMTQFVQLNASGDPSVMLTFKLRILALGIGVIIAIVMNFLFALFSYRNLERKRISFIAESLAKHLKNIIEAFAKDDFCAVVLEKEKLPMTFDGTDGLLSLIKDKKQEALFKQKLHIQNNYEALKNYEEITLCLRNITHLIFDMAYFMSNPQNYARIKDWTVFFENADAIANCLTEIGLPIQKEEETKLELNISSSNELDEIKIRLQTNLVNIGNQIRDIHIKMMID